VRHVDELLARELDRDLSVSERAWLDAHIGDCERCARLRHQLLASDARLRERPSLADVPPLRVTTPAGRGAGQRLLLVTTLALVVLVVAAASAFSLRADDTSNVGAPGSSASATASVAAHATPELVALDHNQEAGSGPIVISAAARAVVLYDAQGRVTRYDLGGVTFSDLVGWDTARGQLALWRTRAAERVAPYELIVLSLTSGEIRTITTLTSGHPSAPLWSADGSEIAYAVSSSPFAGPTPPQRSQVAIVSVSGGTAAVVRDQKDQFASVPVALTGALLATYRLPGSYETLTRSTGKWQSAPTDAFRAVTWDRDQALLGAEQAFEASPHGWRVWDLAASPLASFAETFDQALLWPGRSEVLYSLNGSLRALDFRTRAKRELGAIPSGARLVSLDPSGRWLLVGVGPSSYRLLEYTGSAFADRGGTGVELSPTMEPLVLR
jgi:hypothetical protein